MRLLLIFLVAATTHLDAQDLTGVWREISGPSCPAHGGLFSRVRMDRQGEPIYGLQFDSDQSGKEGLSRDEGNKLTNSRKFLYRQEDDNLYILDPGTRLIEGTYLVTTLSPDSLVIVNPHSTCEEFTFMRVHP